MNSLRLDIPSWQVLIRRGVLLAGLLDDFVSSLHALFVRPELDDEVLLFQKKHEDDYKAFEGLDNTAVAGTAQAWCQEWLGLRPKFPEVPNGPTSGILPTPTLQYPSYLTKARDWGPMCLGGSRSIFNLLAGLHRCYQRHPEAPCMVAAEWHAWVVDVAWGFDCAVDL